MDNDGFVVLIIYVILAVVWAYWSWNEQCKEWNGGICRETNLPWQFFDVCSNGGRGYVSRDDSGSYVIWIDAPGIDTNYNDKEARKYEYY